MLWNAGHSSSGECVHIHSKRMLVKWETDGSIETATSSEHSDMSVQATSHCISSWEPTGSPLTGSVV